MNNHKLRKTSAKLADPYRITDGDPFRLKDFDPVDTGSFIRKKPRRKCSTTA